MMIESVLTIIKIESSQGNKGLSVRVWIRVKERKIDRKRERKNE